MIKETLIFCLPGIHFTSNFLLNFTDTIARLAPLHDVHVRTGYSPNIYHSRNMVLGAKSDNPLQTPFDGMEYDRIIWIDSDIAFTFDHIARLLEHDEPFISGIYRMKNMEFAVSPQPGAKNLYTADWTGFGFCSMKKGLLEAIRYPWFRPIVTDGIIYGDDRSFCKLMKDHNIDISIDARILVNHEKLALI